MSDDEHDDWASVGQTLDWVAAVVATRLRIEPEALVWPVLGLGLLAGLAAEALNAATGAALPLVLVGTTLTLCGYGMLALLAGRVRRGRVGGGTRSGELEMLAPWLRRLQVLLVAAMAGVLGLLVYGAAIGSWLLVARNLLEVGRVGAVVLALSWLLLDDEVGLPDWLAARTPAPARTTRG